MPASQARRGARGFTLLEMIVTATVLLILASAVVPMAKNGLKRQRELELRRALREMRTAIDNYKAAAEQQRIKPPPPENMGYPENLDVLVDGVEVTGRATGKLRFLRRVPLDPMTGKAEWGMRSTNDDPKSTSWGGGHVFDVYTNSPGVGMNGVAYKEW